MKHFFTQLAILSVSVLAVSCSKDYISPEELFKDSSKVAKTKISTRGDEPVETEASFRDIAVYRNSDQEGQSWFCASSGGKMVYDAFMLSIYFDSIDRMKVGDTLKPARTWFSFVFSSDSRASTNTYDGKITLADKGVDYVILHFNRVRFSCSLGEYLTDGYLYCPLYDEFNLAA